MKNIFLILVAISASFLMNANAQNTSNLFNIEKDGKAVYTPYTEQGDIIPDFSFCGYKSGGVAIPDVPVKITLEAGDFTSDDSKRIQAAINELSKTEPDASGFRGAILLKKGKYNIQNTITLEDSGIVLKGEGNDENGTVLIGTKAAQYNIFYIGTYDKPKKDESSQQMIVDEYIPSGTKIVTVADASKFKNGDAVMIERPSTKEWIQVLGMDRIPPCWVKITNESPATIEKYRKEGKLSEDGKSYNTTVQWEPGSKNLYFERTIVDINGNKLTLDIPLTNAFQKIYGGGFVYKYTIKNRPQNIGIENLRGECTFNKDEVELTSTMEEYYSDEKHVNQFVTFGTGENLWVRKLTSQYIDHGFKTSIWSKFVTIEDCEFLDPVSIITGGRRYGYHLWGQMALVQRCYGRHARHDFVLGTTVAGPNAFVDSKGEQSYSFSEPHQRWATGCLYDNCSVSGYGTCFNLANRGFFGTGHGWSGAQMVLWNCKAPVSIVMQPPTAQNFSIGNAGTDPSISLRSIQICINQINKASGDSLKYEGIPVVGNGYIESPTAYVVPQYLYYTQLKNRLGENAVKNITMAGQQTLIFAK